MSVFPICRSYGTHTVSLRSFYQYFVPNGPVLCFHYGTDRPNAIDWHLPFSPTLHPFRNREKIRLRRRRARTHECLAPSKGWSQYPSTFLVRYSISQYRVSSIRLKPDGINKKTSCNRKNYRRFFMITDTTNNH